MAFWQGHPCPMDTFLSSFQITVSIYHIYLAPEGVAGLEVGIGERGWGYGGCDGYP